MPVARSPGSAAQLTPPRSGSRGLWAENAYDLRAGSSRLARSRGAAYQGFAVTRTIVLVCKLIFHIVANRCFFQGNFAYLTMTCNHAHLECVILHCINFALNLNVCLVTNLHVFARSAQASALTSAQCCA